MAHNIHAKRRKSGTKKVKPVVVNIFAFDRDSNRSYTGKVTGSTKEEFDKEVEKFEKEVPFRRYYTELINDGPAFTEAQEIIVSAHEIM